MRHFIVGTAGHIDHGKSALVKALTGVDPDRLKEEQLRGITIDIGFAHLQLGDVQIGFIDVPGHERFVKNMLAGVAGIDCMLLVVAADESIMPQTREHFDICRLLGISSGLVAITKSDLVEPELVELVREEIQEYARGSFLEGAEVIPVSARTGDGLEQLKEAVRAIALRQPERPAEGLMRLPIDRAFSMRGFGTVVTGTLTSGRLKRDDEVELMPVGLLAKVRGIQVHGRATEAAVAGQRTAVNLQGIDLSQVERGMTVTVPRVFRASQLVDARLDLLPDARPLRNLTKIRFHHGTVEVLARAALMGRSVLEPGKSAWAQLRLDAPVFSLHGDAFIIRQFSPATTVGGGRILNPLAEKHKSTDRNVQALLPKLDGTDLAERIAVLLEMHPRQVMDLREINACLGMTEILLKRHCSDAAAQGKVVLVAAPNPILALAGVMNDLKGKTVALTRSFHEQNPLQRGISREELRRKVFGNLPLEVFRYCLEMLSEEGRLTFLEDMVAVRGREVQLSRDGMNIKEMIQNLLREASYAPPFLSEIPAMLQADPAESRKICFWMVKEKLLTRVSDEMVYLPATLDDMKQRIRARYPAGARFGVAEFKELFNLTRKHAIPLLEHFDREHFTRRQGNERILL